MNLGWTTIGPDVKNVAGPGRGYVGSVRNRVRPLSSLSTPTLHVDPGPLGARSSPPDPHETSDSSPSKPPCPHLVEKEVRSAGEETSSSVTGAVSILGSHKCVLTSRGVNRGRHGVSSYRRLSTRPTLKVRDKSSLRLRSRQPLTRTDPNLPYRL